MVSAQNKNFFDQSEAERIDEMLAFSDATRGINPGLRADIEDGTVRPHWGFTKFMRECGAEY